MAMVVKTLSLQSTAQSTECRHEKGAGPMVVKTSLVCYV